MSRKRNKPDPGPAGPTLKSHRPETGRAALAPPRPLAPRRRLFVVLLVVYLAWLGLLAWIYFTSVRPHRHADAESSGAASGLASTIPLWAESGSRPGASSRPIAPL